MNVQLKKMMTYESYCEIEADSLEEALTLSKSATWEQDPSEAWVESMQYLNLDDEEADWEEIEDFE